jgi:hypothetical protein
MPIYVVKFLIKMLEVILNIAFSLSQVPLETRYNRVEGSIHEENMAPVFTELTVILGSDNFLPQRHCHRTASLCFVGMEESGRAGPGRGRVGQNSMGDKVVLRANRESWGVCWG